MITKKQFIVDSSGTKCWGIIITPDAPGNYKVIAFAPGQGEIGNGTASTLDQLYANVSPLSLAQSGALTGFIVIGMQGINGQGIQPDQYGYLLTNDVLKNYPVDTTSGVMACGLSLGAELTWELIGGKYANLFSFAVPMSTPAINTGAVNWNNLNARVLAMHGTQDTNLTDYYNSVRYVDAVNAVKPGYAALISYNYGHGDWATHFAMNFAFTISGIAYANIYDFFKRMTLAFRFPVNGVTPPPVVGTVTKAVAIITQDNGIITLDGTSSTCNGGISSAGWYITNAAGAYVKPFGGVMDTGAGVLPKTTIGLPNGTYNVRLTIQDKLGGKDVTNVPLSVGPVAPPVAPTVLRVFTDTDGKVYTLYTDLTFKIS